LNIANSTIDDDYETFYFADSYKDGDVTKYTNETFDVSEGVAVNLDVESNINISNNTRVAGIALSQGNTYNNTCTTESHNWDNNINVFDSTVTSGSDY
ncbi:autotransporter outer membrane beta-barrel domain-containing protein, partial [Salmonella enterica subsp. enterica serovar Typhimurium]